jgi:hypothetical protein
MTVAKSLRNPQSLHLDIRNANLNITPEQFERLCIDNPNLKLELTKDDQLILSPSLIADEPIEVLPNGDRSIAHEGSSLEYDLPELSPEETARRVAAIERYQERRRQMWDSLTPEEKSEHDQQFEELYQLLAESRK